MTAVRAARRSSRAGRTIRTYALGERARTPDFAIHDERQSARIEHAHRHEYFQMQLNLAGRATQHIGATTRALGPGGLSFVLPYRVHRVVHPPGSRFVVVNFDHRFLRPELDVDPLDLEDLPLDRAPELAPFVYQEFMDFRLEGAALRDARATCAAMLAENAERKLCSLEILRARMLLLLSTVCRLHEAELRRVAAGNPHGKRRRDALARVTRYLRSHLGQRISLADAAAAAELSPNYLAHLLKKEAGKSFLELLTERRITQAKELLAHTDMRVGAIAAAVGFDDEAYFARRFRQVVGQAPSAFRAAIAPPP